MLYEEIFLVWVDCSVENTSAAVQRCSVEKMFLQIFQNSQENICARVSFFARHLTKKCTPYGSQFFKSLLPPKMTEHSGVCLKGFLLACDSLVV